MKRLIGFALAAAMTACVLLPTQPDELDFAQAEADDFAAIPAEARRQARIDHATHLAEARP